MKNPGHKAELDHEKAFLGLPFAQGSTGSMAAAFPLQGDGIIYPWASLARAMSSSEMRSFVNTENFHAHFVCESI